MIDFNFITSIAQSTRLADLTQELIRKSQEVMAQSPRSDLAEWTDAIALLPQIIPSKIDLNASVVSIGQQSDVDDLMRRELENKLRELQPWRKGPFEVFGVHIDTEWRSDMKWDRIKNHIKPLQDKLVLDVGCGSGYHLWRMAGSGARLAIGVEPLLINVMQFFAMQKYIKNPAVMVFPLGIDDVPAVVDGFDTIFSMGLLYHRRSPLDHLIQLFDLLAEKGELILETLVIDGKKGEVLAPTGRYCQMSNVWFIPSVLTLEYWLERAGFKNIRLVNVNRTSGDEQRSTRWMTFQSLSDFLDPADQKMTVEGYSAPHRAILIANK
ncbi:MAG: tRNA 5-methoxyuridine(34)/uridine 5-oxyacetic acid(34) synthase CmoB [Candidatus Omnitrophica bacterium]|nr:tRNA 5-methoxyuridine(34)/uridine 5-oxyacetic acid(34) synthase CmoB [Candidatus Omnitrophota bacterium]